MFSNLKAFVNGIDDHSFIKSGRFWMVQFPTIALVLLPWMGRDFPTELYAVYFPLLKLFYRSRAGNGDHAESSLKTGQFWLAVEVSVSLTGLLLWAAPIPQGLAGAWAWIVTEYFFSRKVAPENGEA